MEAQLPGDAGPRERIARQPCRHNDEPILVLHDGCFQTIDELDVAGKSLIECIVAFARSRSVSSRDPEGIRGMMVGQVERPWLQYRRASVWRMLGESGFRRTA